MWRNRFPGFLVLLVLLVAAFGLSISTMRQTVHAQSSPDEPAIGTVLRGELVVRSAPDVAGAVIGRVTYGQRVTIVSEAPGWLEIVYPPDSAGSGWVSAHYVQIDGRGAPGLPGGLPTATSPAVAAPSLVGYSRPATFRWRWSGAVPDGIDWRFDVQVFQRNAAHSYKNIKVDPAEDEPQGDVYTLDAERFTVQCSSYWTVRVSQYVDGRFRTFLSESSNRQDIGAPCPTPIPAEPQPRGGRPQVPGAGAGSSDGDRSPGGTAPQPTMAAPGTVEPGGLTPEPTALPPGAQIRPRGGGALIRPDVTPDIQSRAPRR
ncbi:MAG: SH3 domain-containing protein [Caldilinea sp.]|nr:SH3 domain-containing protein [Caldilinea sp.]MCB9113694.1 SH3 domain-containing protein [Caldilineaceae bacterium]MCB0053794.1 SH3 domain-containing protein [Caldilinea sp.]MCB9122958.1 SH3 domain-containing protein [Caldilineaceae bacterium]MCO5213183.1 SH3 domain-containing protein [Caldilinea sp.]